MDNIGLHLRFIIVLKVNFYAVEIKGTSHFYIVFFFKSVKQITGEMTMMIALKLKFSLQRKNAFRKKTPFEKFHELLKQLWNDLIAEFISV